ncbi:hypothetical protein LEP1GSC058_4117 [Leptospira fainei serovar Hurstbridge str. BUT 6]|uniref:Glycosyltransferase family 1 n=1 Tax=Leptospira fainei serovar Hurstbridge str. BUT 6 TaxID=1193011 RepID=S3VXQ0_9LEPT|nr:hypothetical protein [Leptospira fainei]EPG72902.1 hypothetical protein LEP1GSC058_4117 [Leptospira fainei serovar Hurstbridge str. BUT 6]
MAQVRLLVYLSSHGFGHISRSLEAISFLLANNSGWSATIVSERAEDFSFTLNKNESWLRSKDRIQFRKSKTDVGIVQRDSLGMDLYATEKEIELFRSQKESWIETEYAFSQKDGYDLVWSDAAPLPFAVSSKLKIPSFFLGNFTWDFIYSHYKRPIFSQYAEEIRNEYALCDLGLILPFSCPTTSLNNKREIGLLGRKPNLSKEEARRQFGFEKDVEYYLFSFGAYGIDPERFSWRDWNPAKKRIVISGTELKGPTPNSLGVVSVPPCHYPDLITACDFVLTKPGYGILSEALLANTRILYTDRGDFPEYQFLVEALEKNFYSSFISHDDLYNFRWEEASVNAGNKRPESDPRLQTNGVADIASAIEELLSWQ